MCSANRNIFLGRQLILAVLASVSMIFTGAVFAKSITVKCPVSPSSPLARPCVSTPVSLLNGPTPSLDRCAIQNAIHRAKARDVIIIRGTCQSDGAPIIIKKSNLTFRGPGTLNGVATSSTDPTPMNGPYPFNDGLTVGALDGSVSVKNIIFKGLHFKSFIFPINIIPQIGISTVPWNQKCDSIFATNHSASNMVMDHNTFDYCNSIGPGGLAKNIIMSNNKFTNGQVFNIETVGAGFVEGCPNATVGNETGLIITGNTSTVSSNPIPLINVAIFGANQVLIANNNFSANSLGSIQVTGTNMLIANNIIDGEGNIANTFPATGINATLGLGAPSNPIASGPSNTLVINNTISNSLPGIFVDSDVSGFTLIGNTITGTTYGLPDAGVANLGDVIFCDNGVNSGTASPGFPCGGGTTFYNGQDAVASHNNVLITPSCQKVLDIGFNNSLTGLISLSTNILTDSFPAQCTFLDNAKD